MNLLIICLVVLSHFPLQRENLPDRVRDGLIGAVKSVLTYRSDFIQETGQWVEGSKNYSHEVEYDRDGYHGKDRERYPYFYYCYNNVDIETMYDHRSYRIDTLTFISRRDDSPNGKEINTYDENDRIMESMRLLNDGRVSSRMVFDRNDKGHTVEVSYYQFEVFIQKYTSTYEYDSQGNWIKEIYTRWLNESGKLRSYPVFVLYREISYY
jgi:hypothetical protein